MTKYCLIFIYVLCVALGLNNRRKYNGVLYFLVPFMIAIVVTRPDTLPDIGGYTQVIQYNLDNRWEPSFNILRSIGHKTGNPVFVVFLLYAIISVIGRIYFLRKISPYFWGSMIVYTGYYFIYNDMIQIRAAVATMLLLPIILAAVDRKTIIFWALVVLSVCFHYSAAIFGIVYFIKPDRINKKLWIGAIFVCFAMAMSGFYLTPLLDYIGWGPVHSLFVHYYEDSDIEQSVNVFGLVHVGQVMCALFMLAVVDKIKNISPYLILALKLFVIGLCVKTIFSDLPVVANRSSELFTSVEVFLIPAALYAYFKNKRFSYITTVVYSLVFFIYSLHTWF